MKSKKRGVVRAFLMVQLEDRKGRIIGRGASTPINGMKPTMKAAKITGRLKQEVLRHVHTILAKMDERDAPMKRYKYVSLKEKGR